MNSQDFRSLQEAYLEVYQLDEEETAGKIGKAAGEFGKGFTSEELEYIDERKYEPDEKLPSGRTPREKAERKRGYHGANYMLRGREPGVGRNDQARTSHFNRGHTIDTVINAMDAGEEPHKDPKWKNTIAARRRPRGQGEVPNERPGGLRANRTRAGGYRTLVRKEEFEGDLFDYILEHLVSEGYAETQEAAEVIMLNMSEEWRDSIVEEKKPLPVAKMDAKAKELNQKFLKSKPGSPEAKKLISRVSQITGTRDRQTV